jgi:hypothetical protein
MVQFTDKPLLIGSVVAVGLNPQHGFSKPIQRTIKLVENHGVEGDAHAGRFVRHRYLAAKTPELLNNRQVHLMASELFSELASVGFIVSSGDLGENVTTEGLDLTSFPLGTRPRIGDSAFVELTGLRTPCSLIDRFQKGLKRAMIRKNARPRFRCGVLAVVKATCQIAAGDPVAVELPLSAWQALPAL